MSDLLLWIAVVAAVAIAIAARAGRRHAAERIRSLSAELATAVAAARDDGTRRERAAGERAKEYATLIDDITGLMGSRIEEAQLPLHILLSSPFGALNENQEEMLSAAQSAVDSADVELRRLRKLIELDRGALMPVIQPIGLGELLRPALAIAQSRAVAASVQLHLDISDRSPRVLADAMLAQEALTTVLGTAIAATPAAGDVTLSAGERDDGRVAVEITHARSSNPESLEVRLARRLLSAQNAELTEETERTVVEFPAESPLRAAAR